MYAGAGGRASVRRVGDSVLPESLAADVAGQASSRDEPGVRPPLDLPRV
jgi:hypothetical protein